MRQRDSMEKISVTAPGIGKCPLCATRHKSDEPHNRDSLYYQYRFFRRHHRLPTWADAERKGGTEKQAALTAAREGGEA